MNKNTFTKFAFAGLAVLLSAGLVHADLLGGLKRAANSKLEKNLEESAQKTVNMVKEKAGDDTEAEAPAAAESETAAPAATEAAAPAADGTAAETAPAIDPAFEVKNPAMLQPSVNHDLFFGTTKIRVVEDINVMSAQMEKEPGFWITRNFAESKCFEGPFLGRIHEFYITSDGIRIPAVRCGEEGEGQKSDLEVYRRVVANYKNALGTPHTYTDRRDKNIRFTYTYWQYKNGMLLVKFDNGIDYEQNIAKKIGEKDPNDPRVYYDDLYDQWNLKDNALDEFKAEIPGSVTVYFLTKKGIKQFYGLPSQPLELGKADAFFHKDDPKPLAGLDPNRTAVGEIPASIPKNAIFDIKTQQVVCYYKAQKFYADEACTELLYAHPGNTVGTTDPVPYGEGIYRFASDHMYKGNSYNNDDVVASIAEVRSKRGDTLEAKIYEGCVFVREREKLDNDNGEDVYKFKVSYNNVDPAIIPVLYTYKEGKLYRGDSTEDRDCVLVIDPSLNTSRLLFTAMTFVK